MDEEQMEADVTTLAYKQSVRALALVWKYIPYEATGWYSAQAVLELAEEAGVIDGKWRTGK